MKKRVLSILLSSLMLLGLSACADYGVTNSADATAENPMVITLAHNLSDTHVTGIAIQEFADKVKELSGGRIEIRIFPNGTLGSETEVMEQLMAGVVDMTKVSAPSMATYNEGYHTFGLPYLFENEEQFYKVMDSQDMQDFFLSSEEDGFVTLTYYTSGARSFYTIDKPIRTPEDLKGLKLRVQDMKSQTDMVKTLGGTPVAMALGDVYTALETGIIDGSENNETAMVLGHGEVCKYFSLDQHSMIPDVMVISTSTWNSLTEEDQQILLQAAKESTADHIVAWDKEIDEAVETAKNELGVTFIEDVDKEAFQEATAGMVDEYCAQYPKVQEVVDIIEANK